MNSNVPWTVHVESVVRKQLQRLPSKDAARILAAISDMVVNPYTGHLAKMQGEDDVWRRRVGAYRIFYEVILADRIVHVFRVARRTSTTY